MGILFEAFEYLFTTGCMMVMNLILMFLINLLRNLPGILRAVRHALRELLILTYRAYKPLIVRLYPLMQRYRGVKTRNTPTTIITTTIISLLLMLLFSLALGWNVSLFFVILAILHGATVGLLWDEFDHTDDLRTGEKIE